MDGLYKEGCHHVDAAKDYRQAKAAQLMKDISVFFESSQQSLCITIFLMRFASDSTMTTQTFSRLSSRPVMKEEENEQSVEDTASNEVQSEDVNNNEVTSV